MSEDAKFILPQLHILVTMTIYPKYHKLHKVFGNTNINNT